MGGWPKRPNHGKFSDRGKRKFANIYKNGQRPVNSKHEAEPRAILSEIRIIYE